MKTMKITLSLEGDQGITATPASWQTELKPFQHRFVSTWEAGKSGVIEVKNGSNKPVKLTAKGTNPVGVIGGKERTWDLKDTGTVPYLDICGLQVAIADGPSDKEPAFTFVGKQAKVVKEGLGAGQSVKLHFKFWLPTVVSYPGDRTAKVTFGTS
ncbi:MAG: hypothetical protein HYX97_07560 [Chloroflexi bacterium]|nr:hypothetical protein [Chloroflexota bacterium]